MMHKCSYSRGTFMPKKRLNELLWPAQLIKKKKHTTFCFYQKKTVKIYVSFSIEYMKNISTKNYTVLNIYWLSQ